MAIISKNVGPIYEVTYNPSYVPRRSSDAHIEELTIEGKPSFVLMKESDHEYFQVDDVTNNIWKLLDGNRTVREVIEAAKKADDTLTDKDIKDVIISLAEEGTIESTELEVEKKRVEIESAFQINVNVVKNSSESLAGFFKVTRKLIKKWELWVVVPFSALGFILFAGTFIHIDTTPAILSLAGSTILGYFFYQMLILFPVYAIHELSHGAVTDYYGAKPHEIGTGLYYLAPFFYCDTSDAWKLPPRARIMISAAGPLSTVFICSAFVIASFFIPPGFGRDILEAGAFLGFYGFLFNMSPIIETDGYYILTDILKMPNLRDETFSFIKKSFLGLIGRPVSKVRQSVRTKRIYSLYAVIMVGWLAFFAYSTANVFTIYGRNAYSSVANLVLTALRMQTFDATTVGISVATLAYFSLLVIGFLVMGSVFYGRLHIGKTRLETIHDKRVSVFMPVPSFIPRGESSKLVRKARSLSRSFARSSSVTLEPPFCVAAIKLGKVDESLDATRASMSKVEQSFRSMHTDFLSRRGTFQSALEGKKVVSDGLVELSKQLSGEERERFVSGTADFVRRREQALRTLLLSAFGTVWTLELSPDDFRRIRKQIFPALVAEDLGGVDLPADLEAFKKRVVFGPDALAKLSSEIEDESSEVYKNPEVYQAAAFVEPIASKLVFAGRTDKIEGSVVWIGGLFLYQAWIGFINEALREGALGLQSVRALPAAVTKLQAPKLASDELNFLKMDFERMNSLRNLVEESLTKVSSTYESAVNFHETLENLIEDEGFDVGLYNPILRANQDRLEGVKEQIDRFQREWARTFDKFSKTEATVTEEIVKRASKVTVAQKSPGLNFNSIMTWFRPSRIVRSSPFEGEVRLMYSSNRLVYDVIAASDMVL